MKGVQKARGHAACDWGQKEDVEEDIVQVLVANYLKTVDRIIAVYRMDCMKM